jgi:thiol-disulfide isomerase/thioredoxin
MPRTSELLKRPENDFLVLAVNFICHSLLLPLLVCLQMMNTTAAQDLSGSWSAELESGGGTVTFGLVLEQNADGLQAFVTNGPETIKIPQVNWDGANLRLGFDYFRSAIEATVSKESGELQGLWTRWKGEREVAKLRFKAKRHDGKSTHPDACEPWLGKYLVRFSNSSDPAIGLFRRDSSSQTEPEGVVGTFLTTTGDLRYLAGGVIGDELRLSCFDGTHVYLIRCRKDSAGKLTGDFWSGASSHQTWTGVRDEKVELPDGFELTKAQGDVDWGALKFPDLNGQLRSLDDPEFRGQARLVYLFGSWCPNCHDAAKFFGELQQEYGERGLKVVGLAFEATGDFAVDSEQVRIYQKRHQADYPLLVAGIADKETASRSLPFLDRVRSFPTAILIDSQGAVRDVYTGFNGPATEAAYREQAERFRSRIEQLLGEK